MAASSKIDSSQTSAMDKSASTAVRRGVAEALRDERKLAAQGDQARHLPAHLQSLLNELRKRD